MPIRARRGRHEAADLGQQRDQGDLADVRALARHVRPGDQQDRARRVRPDAELVSLGTKSPGLIKASSTGCRPDSISRTRLGDDLGPAVALPRGQLGQGRQARRPGPGPRPAWISRGASAATRSRKRDEQLVFESHGPVVGLADLVLVLLQLGRDVPLGVLDRLLADVVGGDLLSAAPGRG